jgi:hypothetical protein
MHGNGLYQVGNDDKRESLYMFHADVIFKKKILKPQLVKSVDVEPTDTYSKLYGCSEAKGLLPAQDLSRDNCSDS